MIRNVLRAALATTCALVAAPAFATDDAFEVWFQPNFEFGLDDDTAFEISTAQRFRDLENDGRGDTYYVRGWLHQNLDSTWTVSGGAEYRENSPGANEVRFLQQVSGKHGILRSRVRLEQRFIDGNDGRLGLRLRTRGGVSRKISQDRRLGAKATAELFWTLRGTSVGGQTGLTGLQTQIGGDYKVSDNLTVGLVYLRDQSIRDGREDKVGHAPQLTLDFSF